MDRLTELSKEISYALRHAPWEYELEMDEEGWVSVDQLLDALNKDEKWESISEKDLIVMIQKSEKKRHEIDNGKMSALWAFCSNENCKRRKRATKGIVPRNR